MWAKKCWVLLLVWAPLTFAQSFVPHKVERVNLIETSVDLQGVWMPLSWRTLKIPIEGKLIQIHKQLGDTVKQGEPLFTLENKAHRIELEQAQWELQQKEQKVNELKVWAQSPEYLQAQSDLNLARQECESLKKRLDETRMLVEMGGLAKEVLVSDKSSLDRCHYGLTQAEYRFKLTHEKGDKQAIIQANIAVSKARLHYQLLSEQYKALKIKAPIAGVLYPAGLLDDVKETVTPIVGDTVAANTTLGMIAELKDFGVVLTLNEYQMDKIEKFDKIIIHLPEKDYEGTLVSTEPLGLKHSDKKSAHYKMQIRVFNAKLYRMGRSVNVSFIKNDKANQLRVPMKAISWEGSNAFVSKYEETSKSWKKTAVSVGCISNPWVEVVSGLKQGEVVGIKS